MLRNFAIDSRVRPGLIVDSSQRGYEDFLEQHDSLHPSWNTVYYGLAEHTSDLWFVTQVQELQERVRDPEQAKLFVVPIFSSYSLYHGPGAHRMGKNVDDNYMATAKQLVQSKYYRRNHGYVRAPRPMQAVSSNILGCRER